MKCCHLNSQKNCLNFKLANSGYFLYFKNELFPAIYGIKYCPFCGKKLFLEKEEKNN